MVGQFYEILAFSSNQLKYHRAWFVITDDTTGTANEIHFSMGAFDNIKIARKYAARMGQCFPTFLVGSSATIAEDEWWHIPDVERGSFCFSDGVSTISLVLLMEVSARLWRYHSLSSCGFSSVFYHKRYYWIHESLDRQADIRRSSRDDKSRAIFVGGLGISQSTDLFGLNGARLRLQYLTIS